MNSSEEYNFKDFDNTYDFLVSERKQEILVLDSSVIFKWFYFENEGGLEKAKILYQKTVSRFFLVLAPELVIYELINIFRFRAQILPEILNEILKKIFDTLTFIKLDYKDYLNAYDISQKTNSSIYDCIYVALSEKYRTPFVTADEKLYNNMKKHNFNIMLLNDFINTEESF